MGTYAQMPRFVQFLGAWSSATLLSVFEEETQLRLHVLLDPSYVIVCQQLSVDMIVPYGYVDMYQTPYANFFSRLGALRAHQAWYIKIGVVIAIVALSGLVG